MIRMIPPYVHPDVRSRAERRIFQKLASDPGLAEWVCLHSLGLAEHVSKPESGMENRIIIYTGIHGDESWTDSVNYVGMSRAREALFVLMPEAYRATYL